MFGFVFGTACLVGLIHTLKHRHFGFHGCGCHGESSRRFLRPLFERLDTTPGQEKAICGIVDELTETLHNLRKDARSIRSDFADAFRADVLDTTVLRTRVDQVSSEAFNAINRAMLAIHELLDSKQRRRLADFLDSGIGCHRPFRGHPYRCAC
jgi:hypothetical protein